MFMWKKKPTHVRSHEPLDTTYSTIKGLLDDLIESDDFISYRYGPDEAYRLSYFQPLIDAAQLERHVLPSIAQKVEPLEKLKETISIQNCQVHHQVKEVQNKVMQGFGMITNKDNPTQALLIPLVRSEGRAVSQPEVEFSVLGPKEAFVESIDTNLLLIRKRLPIPQVKIKEIRVGSLTKTRVTVMYIDGIADEENVNTVTQRIKDIHYDEIVDSSYLIQMISDNPKSIFPQLVSSERPDRITGELGEGKVIVLVDGSPNVISGPTTLIEFFSAFEDYFMNWTIASAMRLIRLFAVFFSVLSSPLYVAILTYHYELIPMDLLATLISSRRDIPFPPILEAIILELAIELLREAGARLPTKVGQTIGIVGGIVIGTAAVEAGITSNVLLIVVALSALASFTTPIYEMSNTIRLVRFPFLLMAQFLGLLGVFISGIFVLGHLLRLTSLGRPYLAPVFPFRFKELKDTFIRLSFRYQQSRPVQMRPEDSVRSQPTPSKKGDD
ncbi:spore germination protein [Pontibacillus sp. HN14]|uniref:Spore germination protein n=2 Tax=Bacillaceae TaxID=186817 RepID=A0ABY8V1G7_9BACI|nr:MULTISPECIES: spore germination protein [Pontibacillus]MCD5322189.1 spore germination protein [Pontibacillus sp. HN14]WIF99483.1 spore germination protein [Pontibacillus chungwhensis]